MNRITVLPEDQLAQIKLGCDRLLPEAELLEKLKDSYTRQQPLKIKFGADPTRPDIHLGHTVVLNKLRLLQDFGHDVIFLIGDYTAMIGDPSGKNKARPPLTEEEVRANAKTYEDQIFKIMDPDKTRIVFNSTWLSRLTSMDMIRLMAKVTVQQLMNRDDFTKRWDQEIPIYHHELCYPLLQGYDSVELEADLELGGTDQEFNVLMGRTMQKAYGQPPQAILCMPLLEGLDGVEKMSKSMDNYIGLTDTPKDMFGKVMSISDSLMIRYYKLLSRLSPGDIQAIESGIVNGTVHPMIAKKDLAQIITSHFHGLERAKAEREEFERVFSKGSLPEDLQTIPVAAGTLNLLDFCAEHNLVASKGEARRLLQQNAVRIDDAVMTGMVYAVESGKTYILKVGKRRIVALACA